VRIEVLRKASCESDPAKLHHGVDFATGSLLVAVEFATPNDVMLGVANSLALVEYSPCGLVRSNGGIAKVTATRPEGIICIDANPNLSNIVRINSLPNISSRRRVAITHPATLGQRAVINEKTMVKCTGNLRRLLIAHGGGTKYRLQRHVTTRDKILQHIDPLSREEQQLRGPNLRTHGVLAVTNGRPQEHVEEVGHIIHVDEQSLASVHHDVRELRSMR
jgi:hypothetical protein